MAITTKEELIGTWVFNGALSFSETNFTYNFNFKSNNNNYNSISYNVRARMLNYIGSGLHHDVYQGGGSDTWTNQAYRTIEITDVSQLTNREEFISFMKANATKQGGTPQPLPLKAISLENLRTFKQECDKIYASASAITINQPDTATQGNLTQEDLTILQANDQNYIIFNNELYRLQDKAHTGDTWTYAHIGYENNVHWVKTISITISTLAWVLNKVSIGGTAPQPQPPKDELIGTWVFNETISTIDTSFNLIFKSNNKVYDRMYYHRADEVLAYSNNHNMVYNSVYNTINNLWLNQAYRTIEITDVSQLTNREEFINFMKANATKQ